MPRNSSRPRVFTATGYDQYGAVYPAAVDWTVSGGGTIDVISGLFTATVAGGPAHTVTATETTGGAITGTAQVTVVDTPPVPPGDLAQGKPAVASSQEAAQYAPANAVDGDGGTRWSSPFSDPHWIYVDLGDGYPIDRVVLNWEFAYGQAYEMPRLLPVMCGCTAPSGAPFTGIRCGRLRCMGSR